MGTKTTRGITAAKLSDEVPQAKVPSLIWTTLTRAIIRNPHPQNEPTPETNIPTRRKDLWVRAMNSYGWKVGLLEIRMACLRPKAMRLEKRKELKE